MYLIKHGDTIYFRSSIKCTCIGFCVILQGEQLFIGQAEDDTIYVGNRLTFAVVRTVEKQWEETDRMIEHAEGKYLLTTLRLKLEG